MSVEALKALLAQPENTKIGMRNKTIMILLYDSAIRLQELIDLNVNDVDLDNLTLHVASGKGNKERTVAIRNYR
ncbi:MAG: tyrosine-type recombinase/integrase [Clostridia bacterium]|nr:tyrosine-type recombinase/integrase [Clostridia bacterium]